jgi:hypothetical protein
VRKVHRPACPSVGFKLLLDEIDHACDIQHGDYVGREMDTAGGRIGKRAFRERVPFTL